MNILILSFDKYPHTGGKSTHIYNLTNGLTELGHKVTVISFSNIPKLSQLFFIRIPLFILRKIPVIGKSFSLYFSILIIQKLLYKTVKKMMQKMKYDVISAQDVFASIVASKLRENDICNSVIVTTVHGDRTNEALSSNIISKGSLGERYLRKIELFGYVGADKIITVDNRLKDHVIDVTQTEKPNNNILVIFNFLDTSNFREPTEDEKVTSRIKLFEKIRIDKAINPYIVLCPRRLTAKNGVIHAVDMMRCINNDFPKDNVILLFAGDGEQKFLIEELIQKNKLEEKVFLLGDISHSLINQLYWAVDLVIIPSVPSNGVIEATSLSALEAMASGIPVVASEIGGLAELIKHRVTGILVPPGNAVVLAQNVISLLNQSSFANNLKKNARKYIIEHHSHVMAAEKFILYSKSNSQWGEAGTIPCS